MNDTAVFCWRVACVLLSAGFGWTLGAWWRQRRHRLEAEKRFARARIELCVADAHLLRFPTEWAAPLKARPCIEKAIKILDGKGNRKGGLP